MSSVFPFVFLQAIFGKINELQYEEGLEMIEDERKAAELYMNGVELEVPECLCEMGQSFEYG